MTDGNEETGKYTCPECHESFNDVLSYGRHVRNSHPDKKHLKAITNDETEKKEIKVNIDRSPIDDYDILEEILKNSGIKAGKADNIRLAMENYEPDNIYQLQEILRQNGINKSTSFNVLSAYCSRLQINFPTEIKERLKLQEMGSEVPEVEMDATTKLVKDRLRRHQLFVEAKTSGMDSDDLILLFPEFIKEKKEVKETQDVKKKRIFPPESGNIMELSDSEYSDLIIQWENIKAHRQQPVSDLDLYKEISQNIREAGLFNDQRAVKDEMQLQLMQSSLRTIESRLSKTEPISSLVTSIINKLNDSGKLPAILDRFMSRFDAPKPNGMPVKQWTEDDFQQFNEKLNQNENLYQQKFNDEKEEEKPLNSSPTEMAINHISGKPEIKEVPYAQEKELMKTEYGLTDDEISQILSNVKSDKEMKRIMKTLEAAKNAT